MGEAGLALYPPMTYVDHLRTGKRAGDSVLASPGCTIPAAPLHVVCSDDRYSLAALNICRAGSRAALPPLPGGEISSIMMTTLTQQAVKAVPSPQIVLPSAPRASQAPQTKPRHQQRVPRDRRRQLATEEPLPVYSLAPAGAPSSQTHPFTSQLLSSAQIEREGVSWLLLQGWEGYDSLMHFGSALQTGNTCCIACSRWTSFICSRRLFALMIALPACVFTTFS